GRQQRGEQETPAPAADQAVGQGQQPEVERRLVRIQLAAPVREQEIAAFHHLSGDQDEARFVRGPWLAQAVAGGEQHQGGEKEQQGVATGGIHGRRCCQNTCTGCDRQRLDGRPTGGPSGHNRTGATPFQPSSTLPAIFQSCPTGKNPVAPAPPGLPMKTSLIVTTYNWPRTLGRVLDSIAGQTRLPDEVIVADDGSGPDTAALLKARAARFPTALRHVWQEDQGFRAGRARNLAIAASRGDYLLLIDGDMVLHPEFVADHLRFATPGCFVQGSRVLTDPRVRDDILTDPGRLPTPWQAGIRRRRNALRLPALARRLFARRPRPPRAIKTCNQGWWREDLLRVNGFDERMQGWGREDMELAWR